MKTTLFILLCLFFITGNFSVPSLNDDRESFSEGSLHTSSPDTLIKMERTICYGFCPAYELIILENGNITFIGKSHVAHEGRAEAEISESKIVQLIEAVENSHFMGIPSTPECKSKVTDHPSVFLTVKIDGKRHYVNHYHGCKGFKYEEELYDLEDKIDSLAGVERWMEVN